MEGAQRFQVTNVGLGGIGGRPGKDGLSTTAFPSGIGAIPAEITEAQCPLYFKRKQYLPDSGGAGEFRGGLGQVIEIANREKTPFIISAATFDRIHNPAQGREGGSPGRKGSASLGSGPRLKDKGNHVVPASDSLILELPGGGGFGRPQARGAEAIKADIASGLVSPEAAEHDYGFAS
jgi:N-methylhydantoinase B